MSKKKHLNAYLKHVFVTRITYRLHIIKYELNIIGGTKSKELQNSRVKIPNFKIGRG
jgi:hypothetical protein